MKLKIGIVGYGAIAEKFHQPGIKASNYAEISGVYDKNKDRCGKLASVEPDVKCYKSYEEMLSDSRIEAVLLATPNNLHCSNVISAAEAGKHILCEKPMALNMVESRLMVDMCDKAGVTFMVAHHLRFKACNIRTAEVISEGKLGRISSARAIWSFNIPGGLLSDGWRENKNMSGGGQIMNVNSHCIDLLVYLFGKPQRVTAFLQTEKGSVVESGSIVMIEFDNGILGIAQGSYREKGSSNNLEILGSESTVIVKGACSAGKDGELKYFPSGVCEKAETDVSPYTKEVDHFVRAIREKFEPISSGRKILDTMMVIDAAYLSAQTGKHISF
ncbi:Gfo/Idh/MocA family oxidoreductase [bacterium]|nr:Gfo/Idh/MocA family oxidoreductase [bacterium]